MQYTWGYIKEAVLAKMDIDADDANRQHFIKRMYIYANEALTQICSAIKPKHKFASFNVMRAHEAWVKCARKFGIYNQVVDKPARLTETEKLFWNEYESIPKVGELVDMPQDFITFNDDIPTIEITNENTYIEYDVRTTPVREAHDDDFRYMGDNQLLFYKPGKYNIAYNARWFFFTSSTKDDEVIDIPLDICDALPSYITSQLYKVDDEVKSQIYRNEFEMMIARIDDTNYKMTRTLKVDGGW